MIVKQYYLGCLSHASYLIADEQAREAAIVDPQRDIDQYLADAAQLGLQIRHVFLTHFHADFVAGHLELQRRNGARIYLGRSAQPQYEFTLVHDGDMVQFGQVALKVLETPGHTPESITILAYDLAKDASRPYAAFTGDTLFIGDVGRPDLLASVGVTAHELGGMLYDSLHEKLLALPDETLVYPAHGAGSMCGKQLSTETTSTIGIQRKHNYALQPMSKDQFIRLVAVEQPEAPAYFIHAATLNQLERPTLEESLRQALRPLGLPAVLDLKQANAQIVDVRPAIEFEAGHLEESIHIGLSGKFATWAGTILDRERPIVIVANPGSEEEAATRLARIGFDHIAGYLEGGPATFAPHPTLVRRIARVSAEALAEQLDACSAPTVLDVRTESERTAGSIAGSQHIPLNELSRRLNNLPGDRPLVLYCAGGYRSAIAASLLAAAGFSTVADLEGGYAAWQQHFAAVHA